MNDSVANSPARSKPNFSDVHLRKRYRAELRFKSYGIAAIAAALAMLAILLSSIVSTGLSAFFQTEIALDVQLDRSVLDPSGTADPEFLAKAN